MINACVIGLPIKRFPMLLKMVKRCQLIFMMRRPGWQFLYFQKNLSLRVALLN